MSTNSIIFTRFSLLLWKEILCRVNRWMRMLSWRCSSQWRGPQRQLLSRGAHHLLFSLFIHFFILLLHSFFYYSLLFHHVVVFLDDFFFGGSPSGFHIHSIMYIVILNHIATLYVFYIHHISKNSNKSIFCNLLEYYLLKNKMLLNIHSDTLMQSSR